LIKSEKLYSFGTTGFGFGARVTGVDSAEKSGMLKSIGADHVIDFAKEDLLKVPVSAGE
jgi:NADPH:quinone reductase-like Zn-dependent oxidoreductase